MSACTRVLTRKLGARALSVLSPCLTAVYTSLPRGGEHAYPCTKSACTRETVLARSPSDRVITRALVLLDAWSDSQTSHPLSDSLLCPHPCFCPFLLPFPSLRFSPLAGARKREKKTVKVRVCVWTHILTDSERERERERVVDSLPIQHKVQWLYIPMKICIIARRLQSSEHQNRFPFAHILRPGIRRFYLEYIPRSCVSPIDLRFSMWPASYRCRLDTSWFLFIASDSWLSCPLLVWHFNPSSVRE